MRCVQAYRKLALTKHPDKQRGNPNAAAEFMLIQKAYGVLTDAAARAAWDELARRATLCDSALRALACAGRSRWRAPGAPCAAAPLCDLAPVGARQGQGRARRPPSGRERQAAQDDG